MEGSRLDFVNVRETSKEVILLPQHLRHVRIRDGLGLHPLGILRAELGRAPDEGDELIIVQVPDPHGPGRLHPVHGLKLPTQVHVAREHPETVLVRIIPTIRIIE